MGFTTVHSANLDEQGRFETDWPADFDEVRLTAELEYLDAAKARS